MALGTLVEPVTDPRVPSGVVKKQSGDQIQERVWGLAARVDPTVTFEEYR